MRFHVVSLPHTQTTKAYNACAYTEKVRKFCNMMKSLGHEVFLYAGEENEAFVDELVTCVTKEEQKVWFKNNDFTKNFFNITWGADDPHWVIMNGRVISAIQLRLKYEPIHRKGKTEMISKDFICLIGGNCQKMIADAFPAVTSVEFGVGYTGVFSKFRVYESYAWMHYVHGTLNDDNGHFFDAVIPNYFQLEDFPFSKDKKPYYLYLGRMVSRKGLEMASETVKRIGGKLILSGQGVLQNSPGKIVTKEITLEGDHLEYVGYADVKKRADLLGHATAVFVETSYLEPFGGVAVEAQLCGTPVITTDWGAFPETVLHGVTGYRVRYIGESMAAAIKAKSLDPHTIRKWAADNFSTKRVRFMYETYFKNLLMLWDEGWYTDDMPLDGLDRYKKYYPFPQKV